VAQLLDLNRGRLWLKLRITTPDPVRDDVITRIVYSQKPGGLKNCRKPVIATINGLIRELIDRSGWMYPRFTHDRGRQHDQTHLLLGWTPNTSGNRPIRGGQLHSAGAGRGPGPGSGEHVHLYTFPSVASYVGGDIVSGSWARASYQRKPLTLYIDIGTNGEIVIGNSTDGSPRLFRRPGFRGRGIKHGMRATTGRWKISASTRSLMSLCS